MPKTRNSKRSTRDVSSTNTSGDSPVSRRRRASPFRGFDDNLDKSELNRLTRIRLAESRSVEGGSCEKDTGSEPKEKKKRSNSPVNSKVKQVKASKSLDLKSEKENSIDLFKKAQAKANFEKKRIQGSTPKKKEKTVKVYELNNDSADNKRDDVFTSCETKGGNFVKIFNNLQRGIFKPSIFDEIAEQVAVQNLRWFRVFARDETPDLRVTAMAWHPSNANVFVTGGKAGTLMLYKIDEEKTFDIMGPCGEFPGVGPGGTMENIRFNTKSSDLEVCTASVDGTIACYNFATSIRKPLIESSDPYRIWFCSVDIHPDGKAVYGGDSGGNLAIHHLDSGKIDYGKESNRLHNTKIKHLEFSPRDPNLLVTASLDQTVKLWDVRKLDGKKSSLESLVHDRSVSTAKFSRTDGCRLLTTDLHSELRVYRAPLWSLEHKITHPHRCFQHLTGIKASWHPRADIFVIGRYPDPQLESSFDDIRCVDVFSASSAKLHHELTDTSNKLITSLSEFNSTGSFLATSSGRTIHLWRARPSRNISL